MNVMKSGLQKCIRRQKAAAARACCDALAKQDLGQVMHLQRRASHMHAAAAADHIASPSPSISRIFIAADARHSSCCAGCP
jgi:hypothetical protein